MSEHYHYFVPGDGGKTTCACGESRIRVKRGLVAACSVRGTEETE